MHFNSIKVRLEHFNRLFIQDVGPLFQFHKGTIRTSAWIAATEAFFISIP